MNEFNNRKPQDEELKAVDDILKAFNYAGLSISRNWVVNFLVAIKSKPLLILAGPPESNKEYLMEVLCQYLTGNDSFRYQPMVGHPWWAAQIADGPAMIQAQSRFNTLKLESMIEMAALPENRSRFFIAALKRICPGELQEYFSDTAFQIKNHQITRLPRSHFEEPVPFPPNLFFIGTIDTNRFQWHDKDLLSQTSIIQCPPLRPPTIKISETTNWGQINEKDMLRSFTREPQLAFKKLLKAIRGIPFALQPYMATIKVLRKVIPNLSSVRLKEGIIYLSNSWGNPDRGLFSDDRRKNLENALDFAILQSLLLPGSDAISESRSIQAQLQRILQDHFPASGDYLLQLIAG